MIALSICVLHYNQWDLTKDCLASIDAQDIPCSYEKVLIDNGSDQPWPTEEFLANFKEWKIYRTMPNRGHIAGQNICFEQATGEWVLFVANDVRLAPHCLHALYTTAKDGEEWLGQVQPQVLKQMHHADEHPIDQCGMEWRWPGYGLSHSTLQRMRVQIVPSTCYLMKKSTWASIGGFDERLETSHEDVDMGLRLKRPHEVVPSALAWHLVNSTLKHQPSHTRAAFHRDRLYVLRKHYRGWDYWTRYLAVQLLDHLPRP